MFPSSFEQKLAVKTPTAPPVNETVRTSDNAPLGSRFERLRFLGRR